MPKLENQYNVGQLVKTFSNDEVWKHYENFETLLTAECKNNHNDKVKKLLDAFKKLSKTNILNNLLGIINNQEIQEYIKGKPALIEACDKVRKEILGLGEKYLGKLEKEFDESEGELGFSSDVSILSSLEEEHSKVRSFVINESENIKNNAQAKVEELGRNLIDALNAKANTTSWFFKHYSVKSYIKAKIGSINNDVNALQEIIDDEKIAQYVEGKKATHQLRILWDSYKKESESVRSLENSYSRAVLSERSFLSDINNSQYHESELSSFSQTPSSPREVKSVDGSQRPYESDELEEGYGNPESSKANSIKDITVDELSEYRRGKMSESNLEKLIGWDFYNIEETMHEDRSDASSISSISDSKENDYLTDEESLKDFNDESIDVSETRERSGSIESPPRDRQSDNEVDEISTPFDKNINSSSSVSPSRQKVTKDDALSNQEESFSSFVSGASISDDLWGIARDASESFW